MACGNLVVTSRRPMQRPRSPGTFLFHDSIRFGFFTFFVSYQVIAGMASSSSAGLRKTAAWKKGWEGCDQVTKLIYEFHATMISQVFLTLGDFAKHAVPFAGVSVDFLTLSRSVGPGRVGSDGAALEQGGIDGFAPWS